MLSNRSCLLFIFAGASFNGFQFYFMCTQGFIQSTLPNPFPIFQVQLISFPLFFCEFCSNPVHQTHYCSSQGPLIRPLQVLDETLFTIDSHKNSQNIIHLEKRWQIVKWKKILCIWAMSIMYNVFLCNLILFLRKMCYSLLGEGKNVAFPTNEGSNEWNRVEYLLNLFIINLQLIWPD